jgi:hypothetical protein
MVVLPKEAVSHATGGLTNLTNSKAKRAFGSEAPMISKYSEGRRFRYSLIHDLFEGVESGETSGASSV